MTGKRLDRIRADFRAWTQRPLERSAPAARTRVLAQITEERAQVRFRPAAAIALVAIGLMAAMLLVVKRIPSGQSLNDRANHETVVSAAAVATEDAPGPLLIYELRSGTKLYLALAGHARTVAKDSREEQGDES